MSLSTYHDDNRAGFKPHTGVDLKGEEHKFVKLNATTGGIELAGADETPIGTIRQVGVGGSDTDVAVDMINKQGWTKCVASAAIAVGDSVNCAASGEAKTATGATLAFGIAKTAATAQGEVIEVINLAHTA